MTNIATTYLWIGLGVWLGMSASRLRTYRGARPWIIFKGFLYCVVLWPAAIPTMMLIRHEERKLKDALKKTAELPDKYFKEDGR